MLENRNQSDKKQKRGVGTFFILPEGTFNNETILKINLLKNLSLGSHT